VTTEMSMSNSILGPEMTTGNMTSRGDEDILNNIINFVSSNLPNVKIDKYYSTERLKTYSKEEEELHQKVIENTQKDFYNKIKEEETKNKLEQEKKEKKDK